MDSLSRAHAVRLVREALGPIQSDQAESDLAEGEAFVDDFYLSIQRNQEENDSWRHIRLAVEPECLYSINFDRMALRAQASHYIESLPALHRREFDWLIVNVLLFAEISGFAATLWPIRTIPDKTGRRWATALMVLWWSLKWGLAMHSRPNASKEIPHRDMRAGRRGDMLLFPQPEGACPRTRSGGRSRAILR